MKQIYILILFLLLHRFASYGQTDSVRGRQFQLTGRIAETEKLTPHCGIVAWGTVIEVEIEDIKGIEFKKKRIAIVITCPELYGKDFFIKAQSYHIVFSDTNQADFEWTIPNKSLLSKNKLSFIPYAVSVKRNL